MKLHEIRKKYIEFFKQHGHKEVPSVSLVPENDPTTLFTSAGMQQFIPYLLGEPHPLGTRIVNVQKCFRAVDIEEVGDARHTTFFEMLGNWSFGDYFKNEQIQWIFEFLTKECQIDPKKLFATVFAGEGEVPYDTESVDLWKKLFSEAGIEAKEGERIFACPASDNWWSRAGVPSKMPPGEPGGPDSELFFDFEMVPSAPNATFQERCDSGRFVEIGNSVFMQYRKNQAGTLDLLPKPNIDFGGGLERIAAASQNLNDMFLLDIFAPLIAKIEELSNIKYGSDPEHTRCFRIIVDHIRSATMLMSDGPRPSNKAQGYVVRRLIRRAVRFGRKLGIEQRFSGIMGRIVLDQYQDTYPISEDLQKQILSALETEEDKFAKTINKGLKEIEKLPSLNAQNAFFLFETYGFPLELTEEIARERGQKVDPDEFRSEFDKHRERSRTTSQGMFASGLADHSEATTKYHTCTHLLHAALRQVLGNHVQQMGSNNNAERLRFDFGHSQKVNEEELSKVVEIVNQKIKEDLQVSSATMAYKDAVAAQALGFFGERYPEMVSVYDIGDFSKEICKGPHVKSTSVLGKFTVTKEESLGSGVRRIYGQLS